MSLVEKKFPTDWKLVPLDSVVFYQEGPGVRKHQYKDSGVKLLNGGNINDGILDLNSTSRFISEDEAYGKYGHFLVEEGDLLIACSGVVVEKFDGKIAYAKKDHLPLCMNTSTMRFRALNKEILDLNFFRRFLQTNLFKSQLQKLITGSAQLNFGPSHIKQMWMPLPPLAEQKRIAAILDKADAIRRKRQQAIQLADDFLRAVFLQMFGDPVTNPKGWDCSKLDDLVSKPITYGILKPEEFVPHGIPMLRIQDLKNGRIDRFGEFHLVSERLSSQYKRTILDGDEILISLVGTIGIVAQVPKELQGANVHRNLGVIQLKDPAIVEFVTSFMQLPHFMTVLDRVTKGGVHKLLNLADLKEVKIPMPPIDLVKKFIEIKSYVASLKNMNGSFSNELFFESLSQKAFSGQL